MNTFYYDECLDCGGEIEIDRVMADEQRCEHCAQLVQRDYRDHSLTQVMADVLQARSNGKLAR